MPGLKDISFHLDLDKRQPPKPPSRGPGLETPEAVATIEAIAREFLEGAVLESVPSVRGIAGDMSADAGFAHLATTEAPGEQGPRGSTFVAFQQTHRTVPIFGARPVVAFDADQPMSVTGRASEQPNVSPQPKLTEAEAIVASKGTATAERVELVYYCDDSDVWHLAYHVLGIVVPHATTTTSAHGPGGSPRADSQLCNVLVDANDGSVLLEYSATPQAALISPTITVGRDEEGVERTFYTTERPDGSFEMRDGLNVAVTFDHEEKDIEVAPPTTPVREAGGNWEDLHPAAVSAHNNAILVLNYFRSKLKRSGIDNKGSELISIVRSTYARHEKPPTWRNAVWWKGAMWYGQEKKGDRYISYATHLEVAAHEMTHGLIEKTANLIYKSQSGALNESFADIFGIIIANTEKVDGDSTAEWSWVIGKGLGRDGKDLRDLKDPARLGYPDSFANYDNTMSDNGGVHINSNIHNKAAHNVLVAKDAEGTVFKPSQVALLYYLALLRLGTTSNFRDALNALLQAAASLYKTQGPKRRIEAIKKAYGDVGIES